MSRSRLEDILPFLSVLILVSTLFGLVLLKMEVRRMGYSVLKSSHEYRKLQDQRRMMSMEYAKLTRPDRVRKFAVSKLKLNDSRNGQIIQLAGQTLAMPQ
ncbi:MAG: cell division protein FtsL [Bdellovibrionales bacterium]|nr:cell division protein FtsL [Bdellovibrionales bacterium]